MGKYQEKPHVKSYLARCHYSLVQSLDLGLRSHKTCNIPRRNERFARH